MEYFEKEKLMNVNVQAFVIKLRRHFSSFFFVLKMSGTTSSLLLGV